MTPIILGGGISGLTLAYHLQKKGKKALLLEASDRLGGWIRTVRQEGFLFETGPRSLRCAGTGQATLALARALDLENELIYAQGKARYLWHKGKLHKVPQSPWQLLTSPLLQGTYRALWKERSIPPSPLEDETIEAFFLRRFNKAILDRFVDPLVTGIYAGSPSKLSMRSCFPHLWEAEKKEGSLIRAFRKKKSGHDGLFSFKEGLETLPKHLIERLEIEVLLNHPVTCLNFQKDHVEVEAGGKSFTADHVYSTLPSHALSKLIKGPSIPTQSIGVVNLGYQKQVLTKEGFGYLVPSKEGEAILGAVWDSSVFPQQNKSPEETRITVMMKEPNAEIATEALCRHLNIQEAPTSVFTSFAKDAIPQYTLGHRKRVLEMEHRAHKRLTILGSSYYGVSVNDCVATSSQG